jgi:hypothetical protein
VHGHELPLARRGTGAGNEFLDLQCCHTPNQGGPGRCVNPPDVTESEVSQIASDAGTGILPVGEQAATPPQSR